LNPTKTATAIPTTSSSSSATAGAMTDDLLKG